MGQKTDLPPPPRRLRRRPGRYNWASMPLTLAYVLISVVLVTRLVLAVQLIQDTALLAGTVQAHLHMGGKPCLVIAWKEADMVRTTTMEPSQRDYDRVKDGAPVSVLLLEPPVVVLPGHSLWNRVWPLGCLCVGWVVLVGMLVFQTVAVPVLHRRLLRRGKTAPGRILESPLLRVGRHKSYLVTYQFTTDRGREVTARAQVSEAVWMTFPTNQPVTVVYGGNPGRNFIYEAGEYEVNDAAA